MKTIGPKLPFPLSPGVLSQGFVFLSGQVPMQADGSIPEGITAQTDLVIDHIERLLAEAGSSLDKVVKATVFLVDGDDFAAFNETYAKRMPSPAPARSTIICKLAIPALVEIEVIAEAG